MPEMQAKNTDRELYREPKGDLPSDYYANSVHVTEQGSIGMNVGGFVIVRPIAEWHRLAVVEMERASSCTCTPDSRDVCENCYARSSLGLLPRRRASRPSLLQRVRRGLRGESR